jgi:hypothetical protein
MISWFQSFAITHTVMLISLLIIGILALMAWAKFIEKRYDAGKLPLVTPSSLNECNERIEKRKNANSRRHEAENQQKPKERFVVWLSFLRECIGKLRTNWQQYQVNSEGDNPNYPRLQSKPKNFGRIRVILAFPAFPMFHIRTIVNKLRRLVNQSGKEPPSVPAVAQIAILLGSFSC